MVRNNYVRTSFVALLLLSLTLQLSLQHSVLGAVLSTKLVTSEALSKECEAEGKETSFGEFEHLFVAHFENNRHVDMSIPILQIQRSQICSFIGSVLYLRGPPAN